MAKFWVFLITSVLLLIFSCITARDIKYTTKDPDFKDKYHVIIINEGNNKMYPRIGDTVRLHFKAKNPHNFKLYYTTEKQEPYRFELGKGGSTKCWDIVITRMSKGEKIYVVCKPEELFDEKGNGVVPGGIEIGFEFELVGIKRKVDNTDSNTKKSDL